VHPDAKLDLNFSNPLELLIALILTAQARDDLVNRITEGLFQKYRKVEDYASTPKDQLEKDIRSINFFRNKTRLIRDCCSEIIKRFHGKIPDRLEDLLTLPGVGRKTANILLGNTFGQQAIGVDTHVMRLSQRLGFTRNTNPDKIEVDLTAIVPEDQRVRFCHLLQYHGRRVCFARKPRCPECAINALCPFPEKTTA
jgi:endonuclease-3